MPPRRLQQAKRGRPSKPKYALSSYPRRRMLFNPQPVFTESFKIATPINSNQGFLLSPSMDLIPQLGQYTSLYQKYKILKAVWLIMPQWTGGTDQNAALYNSSVPVVNVGTSRVVYAVNDTPAQTVPASEAIVLQDNGCKIRFLDKKLTIHNRPVPDTKDANGVQMTFSNKFINFASTGPNITHYGVAGFISQYVGGGTAVQPYEVYCKLTFQLADPK